MSERQSLREVEPNVPLVDAVRQIFERRAVHGERRIIMETYKEKFQKLVETLPPEHRDTTMIKLQKLGIHIGSWFSEYGARLGDFMRNVVVFPMIRNNKEFPKDLYYQFELARVNAWGDMAMNTTKTAMTTRTAYRNNFMSSALTGGFIGAVGFGALKGLEAGAIAGVQGALLGAAVGGALGGGASLFMRLKDRIMGGPPVLYYSTMGGGVTASITSQSIDAATHF